MDLINQFSGKEYLQIDIANQKGLDKKNFSQRTAWVRKQEHNLEKFIPKADETYLFATAVAAYRDGQTGTPTGHMVGLDAIASGIQILGVLTNCLKSCNLAGITQNERKDAYTTIVKAMNVYLPESKYIGLGTGGLTRKDVKDAIMPFFYGSEAEPKHVFGDESEELAVYNRTIREEAPGACYARELLIGLADPETTEYRFTMPGKVEVVLPVLVDMETVVKIDELNGASFTHYYTQLGKEKRSVKLAAGVTHAVDSYLVKEISARCNHNKKELKVALKEIKGLLKGVKAQTEMFDIPVSIEEIHFLDEPMSIARLQELYRIVATTLQYAPFTVIAVFDDFKCPPNDCGVMRSAYRDILCEIADSNLLRSIVREITGDTSRKVLRGPGKVSDQVCKSVYHIC